MGKGGYCNANMDYGRRRLSSAQRERAPGYRCMDQALAADQDQLLGKGLFNYVCLKVKRGHYFCIFTFDQFSHLSVLSLNLGS